MGNAIDPTLHSAALAAMESAINRALALAPRRGEELVPWFGEVFALHCTAPQLDLFLHIDNTRVRLTGYYDGPATTSIRGSAADFRELAASSDPAATMINSGLEMEGDSAPLIDLQKTLAALEIDWEAPLVEALGDVAGHQLAEVVRSMVSWGQQASKSLSRQLEEFIHEEARLSPPRLELEDFYSDVGELTQRVERLEARAARLRRKLEKNEG